METRSDTEHEPTTSDHHQMEVYPLRRRVDTACGASPDRLRPLQVTILEQTEGPSMYKKEIIFIQEGYSLIFAGRTYHAGDTFAAPIDLADLLIREGKALPYVPMITPEPTSNG
jgi:hypothetical protein